MSELEEKLNSVLSNPALMQQIMNMAQNMNSGDPGAKKATPNLSEGIGDIDIRMLQKLSGFSQQSSIDKNQQSLLQALRPYLSRERISKLEKAMRAAKIAKIATGLVGSGGLQIPTGR